MFKLLKACNTKNFLFIVSRLAPSKYLSTYELITKLLNSIKLPFCTFESINRKTFLHGCLHLSKIPKYFVLSHKRILLAITFLQKL